MKDKDTHLLEEAYEQINEEITPEEQKRLELSQTAMNALRELIELDDTNKFMSETAREHVDMARMFCDMFQERILDRQGRPKPPGVDY